MRVYILRADTNTFRGIYYKDAEGFSDFHRQFDGTPMKTWRTGRETFRFDPDNLPKGDMASFDTPIPIFHPRAVDALAEFLEPNGELLPISCQGEEYFMFNVTRLVDALDEKHSDVDRFDDGRVMDIDRWAFLNEKLVGETVFKLRQDPLGWVYVTDPFVKRVLETGLRGFRFPLVWSG